MIQTFSSYDKNELIDAGITVEGDVFINRTVVFHNPHNIFIAHGARIDHGCLLIAGKNTKLKIGPNVHINPYCSFHANTGDILIGKEVDIGIYSVFFTSMYDFNNNLPRSNVFNSSIHVEDNAIIGPSCIILPNVTIKASSSVGANSLVKKNVESNTVVAGNPAKLIKAKK